MDKHPTNDCTEISTVRDRYHGTYSGGQFTAWLGTPDNIPTAVNADDTPCRLFWEHVRNNSVLVGIGDTPEAAIDDLKQNLKRGYRQSPKYLGDWRP